MEITIKVYNSKDRYIGMEKLTNTGLYMKLKEEVNWRIGHIVPRGNETLKKKLYTGLKVKNNRKLFDGDIVFHEIEMDYGDERTYVVCIWVVEWGRYAFFTYPEFFEYTTNGIEALEDDGTYGIKESELYTYAGNIVENEKEFSTGFDNLHQ